MEQLNKAIRVTGLSFAYEGYAVLQDVNVEIETGKLTFILGRNGSGKSTFLRILAGLLPIQQGIATVFGADSKTLSHIQRARIMGFLNQQHKPVFPFSVEDVVLTGRVGFVKYIPGKSDRQAVLLAMEKAGILHLKSRKYTELSGGEQQLVMIARVLAQEPKILLLDEPTSHLDFCNQSHLLSLLKKLSTEGLTVVAVLHDPNLAFVYGDDFLFAKDNQIIRASDSMNAWDLPFLKTIYHGNLKTVPYNGRALLIPDLD
jgi:iron complex transport system ATP-binding protein